MTIRRGIHWRSEVSLYYLLLEEEWRWQQLVLGNGLKAAWLPPMLQVSSRRWFSNGLSIWKSYCWFKWNSRSQTSRKFRRVVGLTVDNLTGSSKGQQIGGIVNDAFSVFLTGGTAGTVTTGDGRCYERGKILGYYGAIKRAL